MQWRLSYQLEREHEQPACFRAARRNLDRAGRVPAKNRDRQLHPRQGPSQAWYYYALAHYSLYTNSQISRNKTWRGADGPSMCLVYQCVGENDLAVRHAFPQTLSADPGQQRDQVPERPDLRQPDQGLRHSPQREPSTKYFCACLSHICSPDAIQHCLI